ncbi:MAG: sensor histidine kinase [Comamonadaceae bacterium]|nr:MAG: sensor histidine kinase [Comamonadaceae bacterium]
MEPMSLAPKPVACMPDQSWQSFAGSLAFSIVVYAVAALALHTSSPQLGSLGTVMLFTQSIGLTVVLTGWLMIKLPWVRRQRPNVAFLITCLVAMPVGYLAGRGLCFWLMDEPFSFLAPGELRMFPIVGTALISGLVLYALGVRRRLARVEMAQMHSERLATEAQLRLLRIQLEPHMLFNTLANLRSLVDDEPETAKVMIDQLILYLRSTLAASCTESTTLKQEFSQLKAYLEIMSLRMGPRMAYTLELPQSLNQVKIPPMLLQPLVENAIKHGLEPKVGKGTLDVKAVADGDAVIITVKDTGLGLPDGHDPAARSKSYGLAHVLERLAAAYGPQGSLKLERNEPQGVCATVRLPLRNVVKPVPSALEMCSGEAAAARPLPQDRLPPLPAMRGTGAAS